MTQWNEPPRLKLGGDGADEVARTLAAGLRAAQSEGPNAEQRARMRGALGLPAVHEALHAAPPPRLAHGERLQLSRKVLLVLLALGAGLGVKLALDAREVQAPPPVTRPAPAITAPDLEPPVAAAPVPVSAGAPGLEPPREARLERRVLPRREAAVDVEVEVEPAAPEKALDVQAELALLRRARAHVRSAPSRALALVEEHERAFAHGALIEEREVIAIEALLTSQQGERAAERANAFLANYPRSAHARRVRALLEGHGVSSRE